MRLRIRIHNTATSYFYFITVKSLIRIQKVTCSLENLLVFKKLTEDKGDHAINCLPERFIIITCLFLHPFSCFSIFSTH